MSTANLEHLNVTVSDPTATAQSLCRGLFGWSIRWQGDAILGGKTVHVGNDDHYLAVYSLDREAPAATGHYVTTGSLNHLGIVVDDLEGTEKRVLAEGLSTFSHSDYAPGRRFYFKDHDGIEFEVVSYV